MDAVFLQKLATKIEAKSIPEPNSGCWLWEGHILSSGRLQYGVLGLDDKHRSLNLAHRASYAAFVGPIPEGLDIDHICANTLCVNPQHLQPLTRSKNCSEGHRRRFGNKCYRGHEYDEKNTRIDKNGGRHCRACHAVIERARKKRLKEKSA